MIENNLFLMCVKKSFGFLEKEFGYKMHEHLYSREPWSDGIIEFVSLRTLIQIGKDRDSLWVLMKPNEEPEIAMQSLQTIVASLGLMKTEDFPSGPVVPAQSEEILDFYARVLRDCCIQFIKGDYSQWTIVLRYHLNWLKSFGKKIPAQTYSELDRYIKMKEKSKSI